MKSILVMQLFRHGAVLQSTPALSALRRSFPVARIHALVCKPFGETLRGNPNVDEVIEWDIDSLDMEWADAEVTVGRLHELKASLQPFREKRFDAIFNLSNNALSALVACLLRPRHTAGMVFCRDRSYRVRNDWLRHLSVAGAARSLKVFNRADIFIHACGGDSSVRHTVRVAITAADERYAEEILGARPRRSALPPIGIQSGAHADGRRWPASHFTQLASELLRVTQSGRDLLFFGSPDERESVQRIARGASPDGKGWLNLAGETSFGRLAALLKRCQLLVSSDTATAHVAAAAGTPCLVLAFGASNGAETGPYGEGHFVLEPRMSCFPCRCGQFCPAFGCREQLTPRVVLAAVQCALSGGRHVPDSLGNAGVVLHRSRVMPDGLWGLQPLTAPTLTLKDLLRFMLRACLRRRLAGRETRGVGGEWRPWLDEVFAWYSLDDRDALLSECSAAAEEFTTLQRLAKLGVEAANDAVARTPAQTDGTNRTTARQTAGGQARSVSRSEQGILALEEREMPRPLVAVFRQSLQNIESLPPRQRAVAGRWNCHMLSEESAFMVQALRDFARACRPADPIPKTERSYA